MTLQFIRRNVYGQDLFYPATAGAQAIVDLTGRKCLRQRDLDRLTYGGHEVTLIEPGTPGPTVQLKPNLRGESE